MSARVMRARRAGRGVAPLILYLLKPKTYLMYRKSNIQQFHVLPTRRIYVFCVDLRTNSHYFPIQH